MSFLRIQWIILASLIAVTAHGAEDPKNCKAKMDAAFQSFLRDTLTAKVDLSEAKPEANVFSQRTSTNLKTLFDETGFYEKETVRIPIVSKQDMITKAGDFESDAAIKGRAGSYSIAGFAVNSDLNRLLLQPEDVVNAKTGTTILAATIEKDGSVKYLNHLGEIRDTTEITFVEPSFVGSSYIARTLMIDRLNGVRDFRFFDLTEGKTELPSLSKVTKLKLEWVHPFSDTVYFARVKGTSKYLIAFYDPVSARAEIYFEGGLSSEIEKELILNREGLHAEVEGDRMTIRYRQLELLVRKSENSIRFTSRGSNYFRHDQVRVLNNDRLNGNFAIEHTERPLMSTVIMRSSGGFKRWNVKGWIGNELFETKEGFVVRLAHHPEYGLLLLKDDGTVHEITDRRDRLVHSAFTGDTIVGITDIFADGTVDFEIIPVK